MKSKILLLVLALFLFTNATMAQRIQDKNNICWTNTINNIYLSKRISVLLEYQWRREAFYRNWQQSLARTGVQYNFKNDASVLLGYAYVITFPYGDYPPGRYHVPEQRIFEQLIWNQSFGRLGVNYRFRLEQRLLGKVNQKASDYELNGYNYLNRLRYQMRLTLPISNKKMQPKTWYAATFDEIFIDFGSNVNQNVFDQNRFGLLAGYQFSKTFKMEGGFFNQVLQQSALVNTKQVYQYNSGLLLSLQFTKK